MNTSPNCLPCFMNQAEYTAGLATDSLSLRKEIMDQAAKLIPSFDLKLSPPENSVFLYRMIAEKSNNNDIFAELKAQSNRTALEMLPVMEDKIRYAPDPLDTAIRLAIAGNIIDYGSHQEFDVQKTIDRCLTDSLAISDLEVFKGDLRRAQNILYLADNCGELVFDRLLIEILDRPVTLAVKEKPIINDALRFDAEYCGLSLNCRIISNGTDCPGTPINNCSRDFLKEFEAADLIISKGQGNFETLSAIDAPIYFMLMVKCPVVANHIEEIAATGDVKINT
jgi:uncharacterized protein with ATP-grasp and redox domains